MTEFAPVRTLADLDTLDDAEVVEGYRDGLANEPEPGNNRSRSYWHGWRNGMSDRGLRAIDEAQRELARAVVARSRRA
jgi:ribosome modulation factor